MKVFAVLTGDIVDSTKLVIPERKVLMKNLDYLFTRLEAKNELQLKIPFEVFRGDSFQGLLDTPAEALRVALLIRSYLKSDFYSGQNLDARIGIGIGTVAYKSPKLSESDGEAFHYSGRLLDGMKKHPNRIEIQSSWPALDAEINTGLVLLETITSKWTAAQADIMYLKLLGHTEVNISATLGITQSAVNQRSNAASWNAVDLFVKRFYTVVLQCINSK
ncbi:MULTISPECIES: SatD family protein [unclassified Siphonobacter]|uniref:SatD family protein n=1 Tax=unclassified Siphonobacter TaxID=2635712 RepID=UPI000CC57827|nr:MULTISPECIES: SatD family protein [unclassified Siphonobacter]MDQ1089103.1 hypothetical protein [Siphonobacter sp. SORGH_AS_1065]MDR6195280.1 hypothetical protein [Siphonobacter sp. SORGH_AS_0500]PKK38265.1 hypothetical protein BWI96_00265 [Siphonobacter sp. SORGH_AS_0500]